MSGPVTYCSILLFDLLSINLAAILTRCFGLSDQEPTRLLVDGFFLNLLTISLFVLQNLYQSRIFSNRVLLGFKLVRTSILILMAYVLFYFFVFPGAMLGAAEVIIFLVFFLCFLFFSRCFILPEVFLPFVNSIIPLKSVLWLDDEKTKINLEIFYDGKKSLGLKVVEKGSLDQLSLINQAHDLVCITANITSIDDLQRHIQEVVPFKKPILIFSPINDKLPIQDPWIEIMGIRPIYISNTSPSILYFILKRCLDIVLTLLGLILSVPLWIIVSIMVKFTSEGPILFKQKRMGLNKEEFLCLKFRTMKIETDDSIHRNYLKGLISAGDNFGKNGEVFKIKGDPRLTRFGGLLRKTSLDELPQLLNVLSGSMSIVGPRPSIAYEVAEYKPWYMLRFSVKPGLTGVWQVFGRSKLPFDAAMFLDICYVLNRGLLYDIRLVIKTVPGVIFGKGAY